MQLGEAERADIFSVVTTDARATIEAVKAGKATYVQSCIRHASEAEIETAKEREWEQARKAGPQAVLKYLGLIEQLPPPPPPIKRRKL